MAEARHPSDGYLILAFADPTGFEEWLDAQHLAEPGVWVKFAKKGRGIASITLPDATEVAMCFGWIDSKMYRWDDDYYILRYQPRGPRSKWSAGNRDLAERLIIEGRMRPAGLATVESAKAGGRWSG
jgi:uncharacterized protein YdeI (YjbR/CyaY-like superfamily)